MFVHNFENVGRFSKFFYCWTQLSNGPIFNDLSMTHTVTLTSRSRNYSTSNNSKMVQDRAILTTATNRMVTFSIERSHSQISRSRRYLMLKISETIRDQIQFLLASPAERVRRSLDKDSRWRLLYTLSLHQFQRCAKDNRTTLIVYVAINL